MWRVMRGALRGRICEKDDAAVIINEQQQQQQQQQHHANIIINDGTHFNTAALVASMTTGGALPASAACRFGGSYLGVGCAI